MSQKGTVTTCDRLEYAEYLRLVECLEKDGDYRGAAYCVASFSFALRIGDVLKLKWNQILGQDHIVITEGKTKKTKPIAIGERTSVHLHKLYNMMDHPDSNGYIVAGKSGQPVSKQYINRQLKEWKKRYNLEVGNFSSHTFRKTFGNYVYVKMHKTEEALLTLQRIFRHTSIATTMIYLGLRDNEVDKIFKSL